MNIKQVIVSEDTESEWLAQDLRQWVREGKIMAFSHIPNETYTKSWSAKRRNKRLGVQKGFPDYVVVLNNGEVAFIELKRTKKSVTSPEQKAWIEALNEKRTVAKVCKGYLEAKRFLEGRI